ncbi:hypothetical protein [Symbiopectobacterium sp.]|uniref:hypothetical protein n=1 Tax=Symbiopectobacterium sp. TaxID=2952789 RepID=UPI003F2C7AAC
MTDACVRQHCFTDAERRGDITSVLAGIVVFGLQVLSINRVRHCLFLWSFCDGYYRIRNN